MDHEDLCDALYTNPRTIDGAEFYPSRFHSPRYVRRLLDRGPQFPGLSPGARVGFDSKAGTGDHLFPGPAVSQITARTSAEENTAILQSERAIRFPANPL